MDFLKIEGLDLKYDFEVMIDKNFLKLFLFLLNKIDTIKYVM